MDAFAASLFAVVEIIVFCTAGFILLKKWEFTIAEAASGAIMASVMLLSIFYQMQVLISIRLISVAVEVLLCMGSCFLILKNRRMIAENTSAVFSFFRRHLFISVLMSGLWAVLFFQALFVGSDAGLFNEAGIALFQLPFLKQEGVAFRFNTMVLARHFLRFGAFYGVGIFGFMAHLSIGFSTYALSRRYAWPPTAVTIALMVVSMPRLVQLGISSGNELIPAAAALFSILMLFRFVEEPDIKDLILFIFSVLFSITDTAVGIILPILLVLLFLFVIIRRHGMVIWKEMVPGNAVAIVLSLFPIAIFSQVHIFMANSLAPTKTTLDAMAVPVLYNQEGLFGAFDNLIRYALESIHLTPPIERLVVMMTGAHVCEALNRVHGHLMAGFFSGHGQMFAFNTTCAYLPERVWFGPVAVLIIMPSFLFAIWRGPRRLKAVSVAFAAYLYLVALIVQWHPLNVKYFTAFYACIGFTASFLLPPWRLSTTGKTVLQMISGILFTIGLYTNFYGFG